MPSFFVVWSRSSKSKINSYKAYNGYDWRFRFYILLYGDFTVRMHMNTMAI